MTDKKQTITKMAMQGRTTPELSHEQKMILIKKARESLSKKANGQ